MMAELTLQKSECLFARKAKVWGSPDWNENLPLEENVYRSLKAMREGLLKGREIKLDAFLLEVSMQKIAADPLQIRGRQYGETLEAFAETMRRVLTAISDHDPECDHCMDSEFIDRRGWR